MNLRNILTPLTQTENCQTSTGIEGSLAIPASIVCSNTEETFSLGKKIASLLKKSSIVALHGPLGAGKTCLTKGIAAGLGVKEIVTSPSYTIVSEYEGIFKGDSVQIYHIDAYRLTGSDDFSAIGGEEIVFGDGISIVEWCERIPDIIRDGVLRVDIQIIDDERRQFHIYTEKK
jgi:tRNA threonylcarbamoyladenosine biosynthesis protein TsaE